MKPPLSTKVALVTGATSGIGFYTASGLARLGAVVFITGRDEARGADAQARIRLLAGHDGVHFIRADAATVGGNQALAMRIAGFVGHLDILVNNVGGTYNDRQITGDGYEATLAMNFVGPFALTESLMPLLRSSAPARVVNLASAAIAMCKGDPFVDVQSEQRYLGGNAYARAKLLNVMWTFALARRVVDADIVVNALHPGLAWTSMTQATEPRAMTIWMRCVWPLIRWMQRRGSPENAARTPVFLAAAPEVATVTGTYFESDGRPAKVPQAALDPAMQDRAWLLAESLVTKAPTSQVRSEVAV